MRSDCQLELNFDEVPEFMNFEEFLKNITIKDQIIYNIQKMNCDQSLPEPVKASLNLSDENYLQQYIPEHYLKSCILKGYDSEKEPYLYAPKAMRKMFTYTFAMNELLSIGKEGTITMTARIYLKWIDPRFRWESNSSFKGWSWPLSFQHIARHIWVPKLVVKNCQRQSCPIDVDNQTYAAISSDGSISVSYSDYIQASCDVNLEKFPFDTQVCNLIIVFANLAMNCIVKNRDVFWMDYMANNNEWLVTNVNFSEHKFAFYYLTRDSFKWRRSLSFEEDFPAFKVVITAQRQWSYYVTNLIVPMFLVLLVGLSTIFFPAKCDSFDRCNVQITVILAFVFFQSVLSDVMPKSQGSSLLCSYVMYAMILTTVQLLLFFCLIGLDSIAKSPIRMPPRFLSIFLIHIPDNICSHFLSLMHRFCGKSTNEVESACKPADESNKNVNKTLSTSNGDDESEKFITKETQETLPVTNYATSENKQQESSRGEASLNVIRIEKQQEPLSKFPTKGSYNTQDTKLKSPIKEKYFISEKKLADMKKHWKTIVKRLNVISGLIVTIFFVLIFCKYMGPLLITMINGLNSTIYYTTT